MSLDKLVEFLSEKGEYNARTLSYRFPPETFGLLSPLVRGFFMLFMKNGSISLDALLNDGWRTDSVVLAAYRGLPPEARSEVHVVVGFVLHETTHKIDLLISPFGVQYLAMLVAEYRELQSFVPRLLDDAEYRTGFPLLRLAGDSPPPIFDKGDIGSFWHVLEPLIRKTVAWGDVGDIRPNASDIESGWPNFDPAPGPFFRTEDKIQPVRVWGSFYSFRPHGVGNWYLRPMTVLETKAVTATLLFILDTAPDFRDASRYFEIVYGSRREHLPQDYLFVLDILARIHSFKDIGDVLATGDKLAIRSLLVVAQSICWFALHACAIPKAYAGGPSLSGNPAVRLFCAIFMFPPATHAIAAAGETPTGASLLKVLEDNDLFRGFDQLSVEETVDASRFALEKLEQEVGGIWNPEVRDHFEHRIAIMKPHFANQRDHYGLALGQPENGNARDYVRSDEDLELFYHDHEPNGAYLEWLELRPQILFSRATPSDALITKLDEHFRALFTVGACEPCSVCWPIWVSRFATQVHVVCPNCRTASKMDVTEPIEVT
jgi:hypothetical protein